MNIPALLRSLEESTMGIRPWSEEDEDLDPWTSLEELEQVFKARHIGINRDRDASLLLVAGETVVGGTFSGTTNSDEGRSYSFDVAILPDYERRGWGSRLIDAEIRRAREDECDLIEIWAVHPFVSQALEARGFDISPLGDGNGDSCKLYL